MMRGLRYRLSSLAVGWLICQTLTIVAAPVALSTGPTAADLCACPGGLPGQMCPMHSHHHGASSAGSNCMLRSAQIPASGVFLSLIGHQGVMPVARVVAIIPAPVAFVPPPAHERTSRSDSPDAPPPRA